MLLLFHVYAGCQYTDCQRSIMALPQERIITHVSNLRPVKRVHDVVEIFYLIQKEIPSKLLIVGEGPDKVSAEALAVSLGIADKVVFFGNSNEVDKILCFSDLVCNGRPLNFLLAKSTAQATRGGKSQIFS